MRRSTLAYTCGIGLAVGYAVVEGVNRWASAPENRAEIMLETFERYCGPAFGVTRPFWDVRQWHVEDLPDLGLVLTNAGFRLERRQHGCSLSDEPMLLTNAERAILADLVSNWAERRLSAFETFSPNLGPEWLTYDGWQTEPGEAPGRRVVFFSVFEFADQVHTLMGGGTNP